MTCYRSQDNWHSYVKKSLSKEELEEMTIHLENCSDCRLTVTAIQTTAHVLAENRTKVCPPADFKVNVLLAIDKNRYKERFAGSQPQIRKGPYSSHLFELKNWGLSMVAAGVLLFILNLTLPAPSLESSRVSELDNQLKQMTLRFDKMSAATQAVSHKIDLLNNLSSRLANHK